MLYFTYLYLFSFIFWGKNLDRKKKIFFAVLPFIIINFIRFGYGADYFSYGRIYNEMNTNSLLGALTSESSIEPLYLATNYFSNVIGLDYHIFAALFTSVISFVTILWLVDYSPKFEYSVLLYYVMHYSVWTLSALRQGFTIAILFYVLYNNRRHFSKMVKVITVIIAMGFHKSSILLVIIYLISKLNWKKKYFLYILLLVPIFRLILNPDVFIYFENLPLIGGIARKILKYLSEDSINLFGFTSLVRIFFFAVVYYHYDSLNEKYPKYTEIFNYVLLSFLLYLFIPFSTVIATRVTVYGYFLTIIVFPMIESLYSNSQYRKIVTIGLASFTLFSFYNEFDKMKDRSGYTGSLTALNTETIFTKDYNKFNRQYALHAQIDEYNKSDYLNSEVVNRVNSLEVQTNTKYNSDDKYFAVTYPLIPGTAIINEYGENLYLPEYHNSVRVHGELMEIIYSNKDIYSFSLYRKLENYEIPTSEETSSILSKLSLDKVLRDTSYIFPRNLNIEDIKDQTLIQAFNMLPVEDITVHEDSYSTKYNYLEIKTSYRSYYAIIDKDNNIISEKWYNRIIPQDTTGLIKAYTSYGIEYINDNGDTFWIDAIK